ncbi:MAG: lpxB, partial [Lacunisphaera sp.]|nr:lpxB [Lacunisphaera sp.]
ESSARRKNRGASCSQVAPMPPWTLMFVRAAKSRAAPAAARAALAAWPQLAGRVELRGNDGHATASAVLTSSGTMSLHCALAGIPGAIAYRTNPLTYLLARWLVRIDYIGIANLLLREPMYPEFIQGAATPAALAAELRECAGNPARLAQTRAQLARLRALLAGPAAGTAADWLARLLQIAS